MLKNPDNYLPLTGISGSVNDPSALHLSYNPSWKPPRNRYSINTLTKPVYKKNLSKTMYFFNKLTYSLPFAHPTIIRAHRCDHSREKTIFKQSLRLCLVTHRNWSLYSHKRCLYCLSFEGSRNYHTLHIRIGRKTWEINDYRKK